MSNVKFHNKTYKAIILMLVMFFSLSPCTVKRDLLAIFDIQHISSFNKVKTTPVGSYSCDSFETSSRRISISKSDLTSKKYIVFNDLSSIVLPQKDSFFHNRDFWSTTGNSPPKYILFKRLKLDMI